ncbi:hypothetical protein [Methylobacterium sp.]|uniref:hypothetical protein n=1 Tax=Methylobacterium sp. TaxID=409 RepID=UPI000C3BDFDB|nr:hypothetical protein [Methylobacterium sp.]MBP28922.1 hypothetical protein [Methylobacterium sp.]
MAEPLSGQEIGRKNAETLRAYLAATPTLPTFRGKPNVRAVARACGFQTTVIYDNPACRKMWEERLADAGAAGIETQLERPASDRLVDGLRAELSDARERVTSLQAENRALREKLGRLKHIEAHLLTHGRLAR